MTMTWLGNTATIFSKEGEILVWVVGFSYYIKLTDLEKKTNLNPAITHLEKENTFM